MGNAKGQRRTGSRRDKRTGSRIGLFLRLCYLFSRAIQPRHSRRGALIAFCDWPSAQRVACVAGGCRVPGPTPTPACAETAALNLKRIRGTESWNMPRASLTARILSRALPPPPPRGCFFCRHAPYKVKNKQGWQVQPRCVRKASIASHSLRRGHPKHWSPVQAPSALYKAVPHRE